jgi:hypothetical protein
MKVAPQKCLPLSSTSVADQAVVFSGLRSSGTLRSLATKYNSKNCVFSSKLTAAIAAKTKQLVIVLDAVFPDGIARIVVFRAVANRATFVLSRAMLIKCREQGNYQ